VDASLDSLVPRAFLSFQPFSFFFLQRASSLGSRGKNKREKTALHCNERFLRIRTAMSGEKKRENNGKKGREDV
jgi:hypothetical protein